MLSEAGVSPKSIILVWHQSTMDPNLLGELLELAWYFNVWARKANYIPMIEHFRAGLRRDPGAGKIFAAELDLIFPILFAGHKLANIIEHCQTS